MFKDDQKPADRPTGHPLPDLFDWAEPALMTLAPSRPAEVDMTDALLADSTGGGDSGDLGS